MKDGRWEKKRFLGTELRGKTLGIAGLGRIGQEVAHAGARRSACSIVAHDPVSSRRRSPTASASSCCRSTSLCAAADYLTLHLPSTPETQAPVQRRALRALQAGHSHHQHGARRADRRSGAAPRDRERHRRRRRPRRLRDRSRRPIGRSPNCRRSIATPHIAASTEEAQELVGTRNRRHGPRFPARRHRPQRRELPVDPPRGTAAPAAVDSPRGSPGRDSSSQMGTARIEATRRPLLRRAGREPAASMSSRPAPPPACCGRFCRAASRS